MEIDLRKEEIEYLINLLKRDIHERLHPRSSDIRFETSIETHKFISSIYNKLKEVVDESDGK